MEIWSLMKMLEYRIDEVFGDRLVCLGLQGSYARGEATEYSDIDAVLILDTISMDDLRQYREILRWLPHRDKVYGFVGGKRELENWDRAELFQFCNDTQVIRGNLDFALKLVNPKDVKRSVLTGACNIYQGAVQSAVQDRHMETMIPLYKSVFFVLRAHYYAMNGIYISSHRELAECLDGLSRQVMRDAIALRHGEATDDFDALAERLIKLSSDLIDRYGGLQ